MNKKTRKSIVWIANQPRCTSKVPKVKVVVHQYRIRVLAYEVVDQEAARTKLSPVINTVSRYFSCTTP